MASNTKIAADKSAISEFTPLSIDDDEAQYFFSRTVSGQRFVFIVTFVKENDKWKIQSFWSKS
jgi:hypothetical protein